MVLFKEIGLNEIEDINIQWDLISIVQNDILHRENYVGIILELIIVMIGILLGFILGVFL